MRSPLFTTGRAWLALVVSLAALNASLTFVNVWPTPKIAWGSALSIELAACVLLLALTYRWRSRLARVVLPALWIVLVFGRYLAVTAPGLYGREFNLYWDSQHLGNVAAMMGRVAPWWLIIAAAAVALLSVGAAYGLARLAFHHVAHTMEHHPRTRHALLVAATMVVAAFGVQRLTGVTSSAIAFAEPVTPAYVRQARFVAAMIGPDAVTPNLGDSPDFHTGLRGIAGADVVLVFAESYGAIAFETPEVAGPLAESRAGFERAIRDSGREVMSAFVDSPTFGGGSWLAHLSLITGLEVRDQYAYTAVMASQRETILTNFERRGYRTVALMPGMRQAWPEGAFYGFDVIYGREALDYQGPQFGWWSIPDQYALAKLDALERESKSGTRAPVLAVFPTSTTHAPFGPVAPYQPDWTRVLTHNAFEASDVERAMAQQPDLTNMRPSYIRAMEYEYQSLAGYLRQQRDDLVMIVIGDHQPPAAVSGLDAPWHVPVHVIASRPHVLQQLHARGFRPGLTPPPTPISDMHALTPVLLEAFDAAPPDQDGDR